MSSNLSKKVLLLSSGHEIPVIGFGTWQLHTNVEMTIKEAAKAGYCHFDCAAIYENEAGIGQAFEEILSKTDQYHAKRSDVHYSLGYSIIVLDSFSSRQNCGAL